MYSKAVREIKILSLSMPSNTSYAFPLILGGCPSIDCVLRFGMCCSASLRRCALPLGQSFSHLNSRYVLPRRFRPTHTSSVQAFQRYKAVYLTGVCMALQSHAQTAPKVCCALPSECISGVSAICDAHRLYIERGVGGHSLRSSLVWGMESLA